MRKLLLLLAMMALLGGCMREPILHLYDEEEIEMDLPVIDLDLEVYWDYEIAFGVIYDWRAEWFYGWDDNDSRIFGELGYTAPTAFNLRRYYTAQVPYAPHTSVIASYIEGTHFQGQYDWGFWDMLV